MNSSRQKLSQANHSQTTDQYSTETINGINLTLGCNPYNDYNLSILKYCQYQIITNGNYDKKKPILDPLEWIKSVEGQKHINKLYSKTDYLLRLASYHPITIYSKSRYIWLGYLKHCIGDIDTAINVELAN